MSEVRFLPVQLHRKLELARVIRGCGLAGVGEERAHRRDVVLVGDVEDVGDQIHVEAFAEVDALRHADIVKNGPWRETCVAAEIAVELQQSWSDAGSDKAVDTRFLQRPAWRVVGFIDRATRGIDRGVGAAGETGKLEIVLIASDDVEGPARGNLDDGSESPVIQQFSSEAATEMAGLIHGTEYEAVTLIEQRRRTIHGWIVAILRCQRRLQVGGVVDGVRPRVGSQKLVVVAKALAQIRGEAMIDGAAVRVVRIHVAEGDAAGVGEAVLEGRVAGCVEAWDGLSSLDRLAHAGGSWGRWRPRG